MLRTYFWIVTVVSLHMSYFTISRGFAWHYEFSSPRFVVEMGTLPDKFLIVDTNLIDHNHRRDSSVTNILGR